MTMPGVIAQEPRGLITPPTFLTDVVFQSKFDGTNNGVNAVDESRLNAPMTFFNFRLSNAQALFGSTCSLRGSEGLGYVSLPPNAAYDIAGDFTVEGFVRPAILRFLAQLIGIWGVDDSSGNSSNEWRVAYDINYLLFQYRMAGLITQHKFQHNWITDTWYYYAWCRYNGRLRAFMGQPGGTAALMYAATFPGAFDVATTNNNLFIGGNVDGGITQVGGDAFLAHMRVTQGAWYRDDTPFPVPSSKFGQGQLYPSLFVDTDTIYHPFLGQVLGSFVPADDVVYVPTVTRSPTFLNSTATNGSTSASGGPTLIGSRVNGQLLIAFIKLNTNQASSTPFTVGGGWTIGDQQNNSAWAWRIVDGTEAAPTFSWATSAIWHARMYQWQDSHATAPIGAKIKGQGSSGNLTLNGAVGLTTTGAVSTVFALTGVMSSSQTIPLPTGYTAAGVAFGNSFGSDRASFQYQALAGTVSGAVDVVITPAVWTGFMIEILKK